MGDAEIERLPEQGALQVGARLSHLARAVAQGVEGWVFALEQPTYVAIMTDAEIRTGKCL